MSAISDKFKAVLFDKDGTLFDFRGTWDAWAGEFLPKLCKGDPARLEAMALALDFDLAAGAFLPGSIVIAGSNREVAEVAAKVLQRADEDEVEREIAASAAHAPIVPTVPLNPFLSALCDQGYKLGVMTNDAQSVAEAHLLAAGVRDHFDFVCGSDSGFGAKPDPAPLLAFCRHVGVDPFHTVMVGDSCHDLHAARAAGMAGVGVLTGVARAPELAPFADAVLGDIGELPDWLDQKSARQ